MIHFAQPSNIWLIVYLSQYNMQPNKLLIVFSFVFLISLLTSKRKTHREWWTDNELVYELTFRPCRVEVYILHTEQIWLVYISTVQGRCLYTAHRTDMTVVYISTVQGRCLYTAHRTDMTVVYIYLYLLVPGRRWTCFYI
jgi:hypothetical protein